MPLLHPALFETGPHHPAGASPLVRIVPEFLLDDRTRTAPLHLLTTLTKRIAAAEAVWRPLVRHDPAQRWYTRLVLSGTVEVWIIGWSPGQYTPVHDHGGALGALAVAEGTLSESMFTTDWAPRVTRLHSPGRTAGFAPHHVHQVGNAASGVATSIHAYSPPGLPMRYAPAGRDPLILAGTATAAEPAAGLDGRGQLAGVGR